MVLAFGNSLKICPVFQQSSRAQPFTHVAPCSGIQANS